MAALNDIRDSIATKIAAITPSCRAGVKFRLSRGTEKLAKMPKVDNFERQFSIVNGTIADTGRYWGTAAREKIAVLEIQIGYLARQSNADLEEQIASDLEDIDQALQVQWLTWPASLKNIYPAGSYRVLAIPGEGRNEVVVAWPWEVIYDV